MEDIDLHPDILKTGFVGENLSAMHEMVLKGELGNCKTMEANGVRVIMFKEED